MEQQDEAPGLFGPTTDMTSPPSFIGSNPVGGDTSQGSYRVLARKYRPKRFADMIGQDALVRTLTNAIATGRLAHAWILTGVRGVGKTTTARIIARALNCTGADGNGGPTTDPCGICPACVSILSDRNLDVIEIDAASNTGVDNIREIIDGVRYAPVAGRYKIYIIDEVHMLSKSAFNALLKTLEEPPSHAKFIFATTEIRKVPVTVLSRCQRFDLRRIEAATLAAYFRHICELEKTAIEDDALSLIARAADGSARDGLSLLDQAMARATDGTIRNADVRTMLGLGDRDKLFTLFKALACGETPGALAQIDEMYANGADPLSLLQDLAEIVHLLTRIKISPALAEDSALPEIERGLIRDLSAQLPVPALSRLWQLLLKGIAETQSSAQPQLAAEMALIRIGYAAQLPTPADLVRALQSEGSVAGAPAHRSPDRTHGISGATVEIATPPVQISETRASAPLAATPQAASPPHQNISGHQGVSGQGSYGATALVLAPQNETAALSFATAADFPALVQLFAERREATLHAHLYGQTHLVHLSPGKLEIRVAEQTPAHFGAQLAKYLTDWTGQRWIVSLTRQGGAPTLKEQAELERQESLRRAGKNPIVSAVLREFPGAKIIDIKRRIAVQSGALKDTADSDMTTDTGAIDPGIDGADGVYEP